MGGIKRETRRARELWEEFREQPAGKTVRIPIKWPKALMVMGTLRRLDYDTTHGQKVAFYKHNFAKGSRPYVCAGKDRGQLFIIGLNFKVTHRGITDLHPDGRPKKVRHRR